MDNKTIAPAQQAVVQSPEVLTPSVPQVSPTIHAKSAYKFIFVYISLIILCAAVAGVYSWQHRQVDNLNHQISILNNQIKTYHTEISALNAQGLSSGQSSSPTTNNTNTQSSDNTARQNDAQYIAAGIANYIDNNGGELPTGVGSDGTTSDLVIGVSLSSNALRRQLFITIKFLPMISLELH